MTSFASPLVGLVGGPVGGEVAVAHCAVVAGAAGAGHQHELLLVEGVVVDPDRASQPHHRFTTPLLIILYSDLIRLRWLTIGFFVDNALV